MKLVASVLACFVCTVMLCSCNSAQSNPTSGAFPASLVKTSILSERALPDTSTFVGTVKSRKSVNLRPQVEGRVTNIFVQSGAEVTAGTPLLQLDGTKQEAVVLNASAQIESWLAEQETAKAMVKSLQATKLSREANVKFAQKQYERYTKLADEGAVSNEAVDQWRTQLNVAKADLEATEAQITAQQATLKKDLKLIQQSRAGMKEQQEQLRYFTLRAPFDGQVGDVPVRVGDFVNTSTLLTSIDQTRPLELYINVPTTEANRLRKGLFVQVVSEAGQIEEEGELFFVNAQVDPREQTILTKALVANQKQALRSGQQVNVRVVWGNAPSVTVPVTAVTRFTGQDFVFVVERKDGKTTAKQRPVKLAAIEGNEYRVVSGVKAGDEIVTSGTQTLTDGAPIRTDS
jgi:multidrug efflux pump subunit AcrA (membrane-fusion protein)